MRQALIFLSLLILPATGRTLGGEAKISQIQIKEQNERLRERGKEPALTGRETIKNSSKKASLEENVEESPSKNWSIELENSLLFEHNLLLQEDRKDSVFYENWSVSIPYTEIDLNYNFTDKLFFELELELSYNKQSFGLKLDDLFFKYSEDTFFIPFSFQWGKFRMAYLGSNTHLFHKKTLARQELFPYGTRALGAGLEIYLTDSLSVLTGWRTYRNKRETDGFYSLKPSSAVAGYLLYKTERRNIFAGWRGQEFFLEGVLSAYGAGADLEHSYKDWFFKFKTEVWKIKKTEPSSDTLSYYLFPYMKWNSLIGAGLLIGSSQESLLNNKAAQFESLIKLDFFFQPSSYFSIERIKEYSSLFTKNSWNFSIKSSFSI